jgi:2-keto-4-pentenoate hydratase
MALGADAVRAAAGLLWAARVQRRRLDRLPDSLRPVTVADGYEIQETLAEIAGAEILGWKIAATSRAGQQHIGVSGPLGGPLFQPFILDPGATVELAPLHMRVAEGEFAFRLGRDLPATDRPYSLDEVLDAVCDLHLAVEVPDSRFTHFEAIGAPSLVADDACAGWFVLGPRVPGWRELDLKEQAVTLVGGGTVMAGSGANVLGDPRVALAWMVNDLVRRGRGLARGQFVTTGTCTTPLPLTEACEVTAEFGRLGRVVLSIV